MQGLLGLSQCRTGRNMWIQRLGAHGRGLHNSVQGCPPLPCRSYRIVVAQSGFAELDLLLFAGYTVYTPDILCVGQHPHTPCRGTTPAALVDIADKVKSLSPWAELRTQAGGRTLSFRSWARSVREKFFTRMTNGTPSLYTTSWAMQTTPTSTPSTGSIFLITIPISSCALARVPVISWLAPAVLWLHR